MILHYITLYYIILYYIILYIYTLYILSVIYNLIYDVVHVWLLNNPGRFLANPMPLVCLKIGYPKILYFIMRFPTVGGRNPAPPLMVEPL